MNHAAELESLLRDLIEHHERMLGIVRRHAEALRRADLPGVRTALEEQQAVGRAIIDLESRRVRLLSAALGPGGPRTPLSALVQRLPAPARERLQALSDRLRGVLQSVLEAQRVLARASESLHAHMQGLMRQVARKLSHAGTYERPGSPAPAHAHAVVSGLDLRS